MSHSCTLFPKDRSLFSGKVFTGQPTRPRFLVLMRMDFLQVK